MRYPAKDMAGECMGWHNRLNLSSIWLLRILAGTGVLKLMLAVVMLAAAWGPLSSVIADAGFAKSANKQLSNEARLGKRPGQNKEINDQVLAILQAKLRNLEEREQKLEKREADLKLLEQAIDKRIKELKSLQTALEGPVKKANAEYQERFRHLVGVYSSMEPQRAAILLSKMDEATVERLFANMKSKKVAKILSFMEPDKAARISSSLTRAKLSNPR